MWRQWRENLWLRKQKRPGKIHADHVPIPHCSICRARLRGYLTVDAPFYVRCSRCWHQNPAVAIHLWHLQCTARRYTDKYCIPTDVPSLELSLSYNDLCRISLHSHDRYAREIPWCGLSIYSPHHRAQMRFSEIHRFSRDRLEWVKAAVWRRWRCHVAYRVVILRVLLCAGHGSLPEALCRMITQYLEIRSYLPAEIRAGRIGIENDTMINFVA